MNGRGACIRDVVPSSFMRTGVQMKYVSKPINRFADECAASRGRAFPARLHTDAEKDYIAKAIRVRRPVQRK